MVNAKVVLNMAKTFAIVVLVTVFGLWLIKALNISYPVSLSLTNRSGEFSVTGEGKVDVIPDTAYVDVGFTVDRIESVDQVQKLIDTTSQKVTERLVKLGIAVDDIKTSAYSIYPAYDYTNGRNTPAGYSGNVSISVKCRDVSLLGKVIQEAASAGANRVDGARFAVDDPAKAREEARLKAIDNAREQAAKIAQSIGLTLGKVVNMTESTSGADMAVAFAQSLEGKGGDCAQLSPGSQTVTSVVTLYYEKL